MTAATLFGGSLKLGPAESILDESEDKSDNNSAES